MGMEKYSRIEKLKDILRLLTVSNGILARDTNFEAGIIYMAQMNPQEPACFEMLGIAASKKHDYNLAAAALRKSYHTWVL